MSTVKPLVFVITPFNDDFLALYEHLKITFENDYDFTNAKDLDNQQNILKDIVEGIHNADVIIADLTGLNANVFYELGLAHAMNKRVIIITQDIGELPFDIKSYRANEYSLQFNKMPQLIEKLRELLSGAISNTTTFGNPVSDYLPDFYSYPTETIVSTSTIDVAANAEETEEEERGYLDYITDIQEHTDKITFEINSMAAEMQETNSAVNASTSEINRVKTQSGNVNASFVKNICRKLSEPTMQLAIKIKNHTLEVSKNWSVVENSYLSLLDNKFMQTKENLEDIKTSITSLTDMQTEIENTNDQIESFIFVLQGCIGVERKLNKALSSLISELEAYLSTAETMSSSVDRINSKSEIVISKIEAN